MILLISSGVASVKFIMRIEYILQIKSPEVYQGSSGKTEISRKLGKRFSAVLPPGSVDDCLTKFNFRNFSFLRVCQKINLFYLFLYTPGCNSFLLRVCYFRLPLIDQANHE